MRISKRIQQYYSVSTTKLENTIKDNIKLTIFDYFNISN